jgi:hypothetical protein
MTILVAVVIATLMVALEHPDFAEVPMPAFGLSLGALLCVLAALMGSGSR